MAFMSLTVDIPETFAKTFLGDKIRYNTQVLNIRRVNDEPAVQKQRNWMIIIKNLLTEDVEEMFFDVLVLCTGVSI